MRFSARYWTFIFLWICYCLIYFTRKPLGIIKTDLEKRYGYSRLTIGLLDSALLLPYALFQIALGNLGDTVNPAKLLCICIICSGLSTLLLGPFERLYALYIFLFLNGSFQAFCWPLSIKLVSVLFDRSNNKNFVLGIFGTSTFAGGTFGTFLAVFLKDKLGWQWTFPIPSVFITVAGLSFFLFYKLRLRRLLKSFKLIDLSQPPSLNHLNHLNGEIKSIQASRTSLNATQTKHTPSVDYTPVDGDKYCCLSVASKFRKSLKLFWKTPLIINMAISMFSLKMIRYIFYMWLPFVLEYELKVSPTMAGNLSALFEIGGVIGSVLLGFVLDRLFYKSQFLGIVYFLFGHIIAIIAFLLTTKPGIPWFINSTFLVIAGMMNGGVDNLLSSSTPLLVSACFKTQNPSALIGFVNGFGSLGTFLEGPLIGLVLDFSSKSSGAKSISITSSTWANQTFDLQNNLTKNFDSTTTNHDKSDIDFRGFFGIIALFSLVPAASMFVGYFCHRKTINSYCLQRYLSRQNLSNHPKSQRTKEVDHKKSSKASSDSARENGIDGTAELDKLEVEEIDALDLTSAAEKCLIATETMNLVVRSQENLNNT